MPPPRPALAAIPKGSLVICTPPDARGSILRDCNHLWRVGHAWLWLASSVPSLARPSHIHLSSLALISAPDSRPAENPRPSPCAPSRGPRGLERFSQRCDSYESHILPPVRRGYSIFLELCQSEVRRIPLPGCEYPREWSWATSWTGLTLLLGEPMVPWK